MSERVIRIRTKGKLRRFLKCSAATDGSVYLFLGYMARNVNVHVGEISVPAGELSASVDYTTTQRHELGSGPGDHVGFKASGIGLTKAGGEYAPNLKMSRLTSLAAPTVMSLMYPTELERFDELAATKAADIIVPEMAASPQSLHLKEIEDRFGDLPFYVEIWAMPHGSNLGLEDPGTVGLYLVVPFEPFDIGLVFVQNSIVMRKGWPPSTQMLLQGDVKVEPVPLQGN